MFVLACRSKFDMAVELCNVKYVSLSEKYLVKVSEVRESVWNAEYFNTVLGCLHTWPKFLTSTRILSLEEGVIMRGLLTLQISHPS